MKSLLEMLKRTLKNIVASESGEFLSTRRKAHLLYAEMYTRVANEAQAQPTVTASVTTVAPRTKAYSSAPTTAAAGRAEVAA